MVHRTNQDQDRLVTETQSFIVKIWLEETAQGTGKAVWRGHITHVPSHERGYFSSLDEVPFIIAPYLVRTGVDLGVLWKIRLWLRQRSNLKE